MQVFHLTWSSDGRFPLCATEAARREVVRTLARVAGAWIILFFVVDDHLHVVLYCEKGHVKRVARSLLLALRPVLHATLSGPHVRHVDSRSYLDWLVDVYLFGQLAKHGLGGHPATWSGSAFPDLIGARCLPGLRLRIKDALPRYRLARAYRAVGLPEKSLEPATDESIRRLGAARLVGASAAALAADPSMRGRSEPVASARRMACLIGVEAGVSSADLGLVLAIDRCSVSRLARRPAAPSLARVVRLRVALECAADDALRSTVVAPPARAATRGARRR